MTAEQEIANLATVLRKARERAAERARCPHCGREATMAVDTAERDVLAAVEKVFGPS